MKESALTEVICLCKIVLRLEHVLLFLFKQELIDILILHSVKK